MRFSSVLFLLIILSACKTNKLQPQITTKKNDTRISAIAGTWYSLKDPTVDRPTMYSKVVQDSCIVWKINKNGTIVVENLISKEKHKNNWILNNNKFYIQLNLEKEIYSVNQLILVSDSTLQVKFLGYKNVYLPFLCDYESMEFPMNDNVLENPTNERAHFGSKEDDFSIYLNANTKIPVGVMDDTKCNLFIKTNCTGEVVEAKVIGKTTFSNKTEFENVILKTVEKMPKWNPATKRNLAKVEPINGINRFAFIYKGGKIIVKEG